MIAVLGHSLGGSISADLVMSLQNEGGALARDVWVGAESDIGQGSRRGVSWSTDRRRPSQNILPSKHDVSPSPLILLSSPYPPFVSIRRRLGAIGLKGEYRHA